MTYIHYDTKPGEEPSDSELEQDRRWENENDRFAPLTPAVGTPSPRQACPASAPPAAGDFNMDGSVGTDARGRVHPHYSVSVTPALHPHQAAYVGQAMVRVGSTIYGGTLCEVRRADPEQANREAQLIADAWNATGELRK